MVAVERLPVYITIEQIIFHYFWDHWAHCGIFENGVLLMYKLDRVSSVATLSLLMKSLNKTENPIF